MSEFPSIEVVRDTRLESSSRKTVVALAAGQVVMPKEVVIYYTRFGDDQLVIPELAYPSVNTEAHPDS